MIPDLKSEMETLIRHRQHYLLVNALLRQGNMAGLQALGYSDRQIDRLKQPDAKGRIGYAQAAETTRHKIRKLRKRITKQRHHQGVKERLTKLARKWTREADAAGE